MSDMTVVFARSSANASEAAKGFTLVSYRLYNRTLTDAEVEENAALDQIRYLAPPSVAIDGKPCTEVIVFSPNFLMCKVPAGSAKGKKDVEINGVTFNDAYEYVEANAFYIHSISPMIGSAGQILTLTGNKLDEITEIKAGAQSCTITNQSANSCACTLPSHPSGEVDITIATISTTYWLSRAFEYQ
jgi:hypothetical protein